MPNGEDFRPLVQYSPLWLILGIIIAVVIAVWFGLIFFLTRKKTPRTIANLAPLPPKQVDIEALRAKYLAMIDKVEADVISRIVTSRAAHLSLSRIVREFAFEASGFRAPNLTLADFEKSGRTDLTDAIRRFYPREFARISRGDMTESLASARKVVQQWH